MAPYTRQRTTRGLPTKRTKIADGNSRIAPDLHLDTSDLMDMGYECVDGEPPAAAAKLRSGTSHVLYGDMPFINVAWHISYWALYSMLDGNSPAFAMVKFCESGFIQNCGFNVMIILKLSMSVD